jgi:hypothetical protein
MPDDNTIVMLAYRLRGDPEPQAMPVRFEDVLTAVRVVDESSHGILTAEFVEISFKTPDDRSSYLMLRISDIVEFAWSELPRVDSP